MVQRAARAPQAASALFLALLAAACAPSAAIVGSTAFPLRAGASHELEPPFGFAAGGSIDISVALYGTDGGVVNETAVAPSGIFFLACTDDTLTAVLRLTSASDSDCLAGMTYAASRCEVPPVLVNSGLHLKADVLHDATLTLAFINCNYSRASAVGIDYILLNPGGQNLPTAEAPLPVVYLVFALAWSGIAAAACVVGTARWAATCPVHSLLFSVPLLKVVHMAVAQSKWTALNRMGVRNVPLDMTLVVVLTVSQVDYLGVLLVLSRGWHVTRTSLGAPERNSLLLSLSLLASLFFVRYLWSPRSYFALAIAYICVLGFALSSVSYGLRHLKAQAHLLRISGSAADDAAAWARVQMFAGFHGAMFVFTSVKLVLHLVALFMPEEAWLNVLFAEVSDIGLALVMGVLFRPRLPSPFVEEDTAGVLRAAAGDVIAGRARLAMPSDDDLARAISQLHPRAPSGASPGGGDSSQPAAPSPAPLPVLVENPCSFDSVGRAVVSVSVGLPQQQTPKPEDAPPHHAANFAGGGEGVATSPAADSPQEPLAQQQQPRPWHRLAPAGDAHELSSPQPPQLDVGLTVNPLWERRLTQTQPPVRDERESVLAAADRFRILWGAPPERPQPSGGDDAA